MAIACCEANVQNMCQQCSVATKKKKLFFRLFNMREDIFVFLGILDPSSRMSACSPELHLLKQTNRLQVVTEIKKKKKKTWKGNEKLNKSGNLTSEGSLKKLDSFTLRKKEKTKGDQSSSYLVCKRCFKEDYYYDYFPCILYG